MLVGLPYSFILQLRCHRYLRFLVLQSACFFAFELCAWRAPICNQVGQGYWLRILSLYEAALWMHMSSVQPLSKSNSGESTIFPSSGPREFIDGVCFIFWIEQPQASKRDGDSTVTHLPVCVRGSRTNSSLLSHLRRLHLIFLWLEDLGSNSSAISVVWLYAQASISTDATGKELLSWNWPDYPYIEDVIAMRQCYHDSLQDNVYLHLDDAGKDPTQLGVSFHTIFLLVSSRRWVGYCILQPDW